MTYLMFAGDDYEASGGWSDHVLTTNNLEEALKQAPIEINDWIHIYELESDIIVFNYFMSGAGLRIIYYNIDILKGEILNADKKT